ncbi:hypothetical protein [Nocardioides albus]|uniref:Uncharacterized protein n=1 Tax=Nocardioides albus TaxID=1841 RepID=A0A7W5A547_9ACTN|nr:hypothetical protein [Nocardioides albus]MBB3089881.1 hypothetical protein [Nocardioides albus]GGU36302.1 hypothetical protein GCM10007979_39250 [Nocardioides albus]
MTWSAAVTCAHRGILGPPQTHLDWACDHSYCPAPLRLGPWTVAVSGTIDDSWTLILDNAQHQGLPVGSAVVQIGNEIEVGGYSVLLSDGEDLALLTGDEGSHLAVPASWEYVVSSRPLAGAPSTPIPPRTIGVLSPCGPTWWRLDAPLHNSKENHS